MSEREDYAVVVRASVCEPSGLSDVQHQCDRTKDFGRWVLTAALTDLRVVAFSSTQNKDGVKLMLLWCSLAARLTICSHLEPPPWSK